MPDYRPMTDYLRGIFHGRVIKIAVNAGLGCPNRDGTVGRDGCIYCNNLTFNPPMPRPMPPQASPVNLRMACGSTHARATA